MAFAIKRKEKPGQACARVGRELLTDAEQLLNTLPSSDDAPEAIHEIRKTFKKLRGLNRLLRPALRQKDYEKLNTLLRDTARRLAQAREHSVALETLSRLSITNSPGMISTSLAMRLHSGLEALNTQTLQLELSPDLIAQLRETLTGVAGHLKRWQKEKTGWAPAEEGLRLAYRAARNGYKASIDAPDCEPLHEWRKAVKTLWYQLRLFEPIWPGGLVPLTMQIHELEELLGRDHDLENFETLGLHVLNVPETEPEALELMRVIDEQHRRTQSAALALGKILFADPPRRFIARFQALRLSWEEL